MICEFLWKRLNIQAFTLPSSGGYAIQILLFLYRFSSSPDNLAGGWVGSFNILFSLITYTIYLIFPYVLTGLLPFQVSAVISY